MNNVLCSLCGKFADAESGETFQPCPTCSAILCAQCATGHVEFCKAKEATAATFGQPSVGERKARRDAYGVQAAIGGSHLEVLPKVSKPVVADVPAAGETIRVLRGGILTTEVKQ